MMVAVLKQASGTYPYDAVIVGMGDTGLSCVRFLAARHQRLAVMDTRDEPPGLAVLEREHPGIKCVVGGLDHALFEQAPRVVLSPGVALDIGLRRHLLSAGTELIGDIELFCRYATAPIIAVTGSNGKSTVVSLLAAMARHAGMTVPVGGNLGTPALELLDEVEAEYFILELSSFQLESTYSLQAHAAVVLNIGPDHLDRHVDIDTYAELKCRVYQSVRIPVVNGDDPRIDALPMPECVRYSLYDARAEWGLLEVDGECWLRHWQRPLIPRLALWSQRNCDVSNALACMALATTMRIPESSICAVLSAFEGLPHRCQRVARIGGVSWYDDSKATNVDACLAAVNGLCGAEGELVLIAGGDAKGQDFSKLVAGLVGRVAHVVLLGKDAERLAESLSPELPCQRVVDMREAVEKAAELVHEGQVLLSPACSSLDMFRDYRHRGEVFAGLVRSLEGDT